MAEQHNEPRVNEQAFNGLGWLFWTVADKGKFVGN